MRYRDDIDGLRAVAVLSVLLSHLGIPGFSGGFVGVDIFFVISGFLITSIIRDEMARGAFSLAAFYERRARRILPALFVVLIATTLAAGHFMTPADYDRFAESLLYALLFGSNFFFSGQSGYFASPSETMPLLHTWSLAVEEQFYIVWPLVLLVIARWVPQRLLAIAGFLFAGSLALSVAETARSADGAFYLAHTRGWELLMGALLALGVFGGPVRGPARHALGLAGLVLIVFAIAAYSSATPFPGAAALVPCLGAALVIQSCAVRGSAAGALLGMPILAGIGRTSYSLYLWHWPLIAFTRYVHGEALTVGQAAAIVSVSFALAVLTYFLIEQPCRAAQRGRERLFLFRGLAGSSALLLTCVVAILATGGLPQRLTGQAAAYAVGETDFADKDCSNMPVQRVRDRDLCRAGTKGSARGDVTALLWGDSHANALVPALDAAASRSGARVLHASRNGCPPLPGVSLWHATGKADHSDMCSAFNAAMMDVAIASHITDVVLVARWNLLTNGRSARGVESGQPAKLIADERSQERSIAENMRVLERSLRRTTTRLAAHGKRVWFVEQVPYVGFRVAQRLTQIAMSGRAPDLTGPALAEHQIRSQAVRALTQAIAAETPAFSTIDLSQRLCPGGVCRIEAEQRCLYYDDDHLTRFGALYVAGAFAPVFAPLRHAANRQRPAP